MKTCIPPWLIAKNMYGGKIFDYYAWFVVDRYNIIHFNKYEDNVILSTPPRYE